MLSGKAKLEEVNTATLCARRLNAMSSLSEAKHVDAAALIDEIDKILMARLAAPDNGWSSGMQGQPRYLLHDGRKAAVVIRSETHGQSKGSYLIEVNGKVLCEAPRHVEHARELAEAELAKCTSQDT